MDQVEQVRQLVRSQFAALDSTLSDGLHETILIRDGHYCGRRFRSGELHATWFLEENEIKVYGDDGTVVRFLAPAPKGDHDDRLVA